MLEVLVTLLIISMMSLLVLNRHSVIEKEHMEFLNDYLLLQSEVMLNRNPEAFRNGVTFNEMGHVNIGRTVSFGRHEVIIHLGNGYATCR